MGEGTPRIILVGHCGPDSYMLKSAVQRMAPGAAVEFAMNEEALQRELGEADLLLINRLLDGDYALGTGVELIRKVVGSGAARRPAMMLVSNFAEAQAEAVAAGAAPGFGKREIGAEETKKKVLAALGR